MEEETRVLIVEHNEADVKLAGEQLKKNGIKYILKVVQTEKAFSHELTSFRPDIILSDYMLPAFSGIAAFAVREKIAPGIPFIFVSGTIGEEKSIELVRSGATDFVLKENIVSLSVKVKRALLEAKEKQERDRMSEALRHAHRDINKIMDESMDIICTIDAAGCFIRVSAACKAIWGYTSIDLQGRKAMDFVCADDQDHSRQATARVISGEDLTNFENRYVHKSGSLVPMAWTLHWSEKDQVSYGVARDITQKKQWEKALETERQQFYEFFLQAPTSIGVLKGPNHVYDMVNNLYRALICRQDILGRTVKEVLPETVNQGFIEILDNVYKTGQAFVANEKLMQLDITGNGRLTDFYLDIVYQAYRNGNNEIEGVFFFTVDVTEQVQSRKKIEKSEKLFRQIVETSQEGIWLFDEMEQTTFVNEKMCTMLGHSMQELADKKIYDFMDNKTDANSVEKMEGRKLAMSEIYDSVFYTKSGKSIWVSVSVNPLKDENGRYKGSLAMITDISERKSAEQEMTWLINNTEESFVLLDSELFIVSFNQQFRQLYHQFLGTEVNKGDNILDYVKVGKKTFIKGIYERVLEGGKEEAEIVIPVTNGEQKNFALNYKPAKDDNGKVIGVFISAVDITIKKQSEQQLVMNEKRYRALIENGADAVAILTPDGKPLYISPALEKVLGYTGEEGLALNIFSLLHPDDIYGVKQTWEKVLGSSGEPINSSTSRMRHKDGTWRWIEATVTNLMHDPAVNGIVDNFRDVTEKVIAAELKAFEKRDKEALINSTDDLIWSVSHEFKLIAANSAFISAIESLTGKCIEPGDDLLSEEIFTNEYLPFWKDCYKTALLGEPVRKEVYSPAFNEWKESWADINFNPVFQDNRVVAIACYSRDITEKKNAGIALIKRDSQLTLAAEMAKLGYWEQDLITGLFTFTSEFYAIFKTTAEITGGYTMTADRYTELFIHPEDRDIVVKSVAEAINSSDSSFSYKTEHRIIYATGETGYISVHFFIVKDSAGRTIKNFGVNQDITERKEAELKLRKLNESLIKQTRELALSNAALEQFAYVASHDLQEPLRMVTSFIALLGKRYSNVIDDKGHMYISFATDGAKRMRQIILDLLEYSKIGKYALHTELIDLDVLITDLKFLFRNQIIEKNAIITTDKLPMVTGHRSPVRQVFQNLIGNALKYTAAQTASRIHISARDCSDGFWEFSVADNGIGIAEEYFDRIFIIFQRLHNKDEYSGTGMGLAITKKIIESQGGRIWLESEEGKGSHFYFTIPKPVNLS